MVSGYRNVARALRQNLESANLRLAYFFVAASYNLTEHAFRQLHPVWIAFLLAITAVPEQPVEKAQEIDAQLSEPPRRTDWSIARA
jgi:hypothetical protein